MEQEVIILEQNENFVTKMKIKMKIAVCNADDIFLSEIKRQIYRYSENRKIELFVDCYFSGEDLLNGGGKYNLIFLGYSLKGKNGLEIAREIRKNNDDVSIIFTSENTDFVLEAFKVEAYRFLVYPLSEETVFGVMDEYFEKFGFDYPIWIKSNEDIICLNTSEIFYLEADNKHCLVHLKDCVLPCKRTMARVYNVVPKNHFIKINRAFVVNFDYIEKYNNDLVYLKNGSTVHISRNYLKAFKSEYTKFLSPLLP